MQNRRRGRSSFAYALALLVLIAAVTLPAVAQDGPEAQSPPAQPQAPDAVPAAPETQPESQPAPSSERTGTNVEEPDVPLAGGEETVEDAPEDEDAAQRAGDGPATAPGASADDQQPARTEGVSEDPVAETGEAAAAADEGGAEEGPTAEDSAAEGQEAAPAEEEVPSFTSDTTPAAAPSRRTSAGGGGASEEGSAAEAAAARRAVRERRSEAITQSIERLRSDEAADLSDTQKAALVGQIAQGARVELGALREETAEARLTLERLQQMAREIKRARRSVPHEVRTGQIPSLGASNRWDALQETNTELQQAIDRAFTERLRLLSDIPQAEEALEQVQSLRASSGQSFEASLQQVLKDAEDYLEQRLEAMQNLLDLYNEQAAIATDAYDDSSQYTEELSAAMVAARERGMLARAETSISWDTFRALGESIGNLSYLRSRVASGYEAQGRPAQTMLSWLLRVATTVLLLAVLVAVWLKLPGWLLSAFDSGGEQEPRADTDGGEDLQALRDRRQAELTLPVARAALLAAVAALGLHLWGLPQEWIVAALALLGTWAAYFAFVAIMRNLLAPRHQDLRIVPIDTSAAAALYRLLRGLALWSAVMLPIIWALSVLDYERNDVLTLLSVVHVVGLAVIAGWLIYGAGGPTEFLEGAKGGALMRRVATTAVPVILGLGAAIAVLKAIGYVNLGSYLARILYLDLPLAIVALILDWQVRQRFAEGTAWRTRLRAALWAAVGLSQIWVLGLRYHHWLALMDFLKRPLFTVAETEVSVFSILRAIVVILVAWLIAKYLRRWLSRSQRIRSHLSEGVQYALSSLTFYIILIAGILWAMLVGGFPLNALTVLAGMAGIGLGFGLQDVVSNFVAGLILLLERPLAVGDYIEVAGTWGRVMSISLRSTVVRTQDNAHILVPNSDIISNQLTNLSHRDRTLRVVIPVGVGYDADIDEVMAVLVEVAEDCENVRSFPTPKARLAEFGDSAIVVELLVWIADPSTQVGTEVDLNLEIWRALKREGIEIPFPQRDLHLRADSAPLRIQQIEGDWRDAVDEDAPRLDPEDESGEQPGSDESP